ncbi:MAG: hypothetical protein E7206_22950 [Clostridium beijerinckii]|nr:hypothetical protein [Clostridium beijerinckii]
MWGILEQDKKELRKNLNCRICPSIYEEINGINESVVKDIDQVSITEEKIIFDMMNRRNTRKYIHKHDVKLYLLV